MERLIFFAVTLYLTAEIRDYSMVSLIDNASGGRFTGSTTCMTDQTDKDAERNGDTYQITGQLSQTPSVIRALSLIHICNTGYMDLYLYPQSSIFSHFLIFLMT